MLSFRFLGFVGARAAFLTKQVPICILLLLTALPLQSFALNSLDVVGYRTTDIDGQLIRLGMDEDPQSVVVSFIDPLCNESEQVAKSVRLAQQGAVEHGFRHYTVIFAPTLSRQQVKDYVSSLSLSGTILLDSTLELAHRVELKQTPEAVVVNTKDQEIYRGPVRGVAQVVAGNTNPTNLSDGKLCSVSKNLAALPGEITYNRHMKSLVHANCLLCHSEGGVAPFQLKSFDATKAWSGMMAHVTQSRFMPPWRGLSSPGHRFRNERRLSQRQIDFFQAWIDQGLKKGSEEDSSPDPVIENAGWRLGTPDIILTMDEPFEVPAEGDDVYRYFVMKDAIPKDMTIVAIDFMPGDPAVVHHCNFFMDYENRARKMDAKDPKPGFKVIGNGFMDYFGSEGGQFPMGAWAPGGDPVQLPSEMGIMIPGGGDFVVEIHYHLNGKRTKDQSSVGIYLAKKPVEKAVTGLFMGTMDVDIPAGAHSYWRHFYMDVNHDMDLIDIAAHMHYIGKEVKIIATLPGGIIKPLLLIKNWDLRWQNVYAYRDPIFIPKGTRIDAYMSFDNSADNPANPFSPPVDMKWGWASDQEMAEIYLTIYPRPGWRGWNTASNKLIKASLKPWSRGADIDIKKVPSDDVFGF